MRIGASPTPPDDRGSERYHGGTVVPVLTVALILSLIALVVVAANDPGKAQLPSWAQPTARWHKNQSDSTLLLNPGDPGFEEQETDAVARYGDPWNGEFDYSDVPWTTFTHPTPGMSIDMDEESSCTLGFIGVQGADYAGQSPAGTEVGLTAGHCTFDGSYDLAHWSPSPTGSPELLLGQFGAAEHSDENRGGRVADDTDFSEISLLPDLSASHLIGNRYRVTDVFGPRDLHEGMEVCKFGFRTEETCGPVISWNDTFVRINLFSLIGDSGSPAYVKLGNGNVAALGLLSGSPFAHDEVNDFVTDFALVKPVVDSMGIDLITPAEPATPGDRSPRDPLDNRQVILKQQ